MDTLQSKLSDEIRIGAGQIRELFGVQSGTMSAVTGVEYGSAFFCFLFLTPVVYSLLQGIALGPSPNVLGIASTLQWFCLQNG